ncbi:tyrosine-type recombinase/integrase [Rhizobium sp. GN54]|uniref:tyrosine-type recombinase/integrase n=1 Tax=Rhizobium sp. GN54 TaxID=2898150 RepID=UPI001E3621A5|nr:site-specific integrase [Rhizobium sp. GN54]MCD2185213.1 site-specific integrase [Rhizobium sp. GN54]
MSVYKSPKSPFYQYDFQIQRRRFFGSTEASNKKDAEAVERQLKAKARADIELEKKNGTGPLTLDVAAGGYWQAKGEAQANSAGVWRTLNRFIATFGNDRRLDAITDRELTFYVTARKKDRLRGRVKDKAGNPVRTVSNATINREIAILKRLMLWSRKAMKQDLPQEPNWRDHWLPEAQERVRELHDHEGEALDSAIRDDYAPWLEFARLTGLRRAETLIRWTAVNWSTGQIRTPGKGGRWVTTPITPAVRAILEQCKGHHPEFVFTYVAKRTHRGKVRGQRYPLTYAGTLTEWRRTKDRAEITDFRFHDIRHDVATKALRSTGNLKLVQRILNHTDVKTTSRYAHVLDEEVGAALEAMAKSRNKSRIDTPDVA